MAAPSATSLTVVIDAQRTKAAVNVTIGYSGATVQMDKKDGAWIARELTTFWVA